MEPYIYNATVLRTKDGDTAVLLVDLGFSITIKIDGRVRGINCHEIHSKDAKEKKLGMADWKYGQSIMPDGSPVRVRSYKPDKYGGRWSVDILLPDGGDYAAAMLKAGHARPYDGGKR